MPDRRQGGEQAAQDLFSLRKTEWYGKVVCAARRGKATGLAAIAVWKIAG